MKTIAPIILSGLLFTSTIDEAAAQDSTIVYQENARMFSNKYIFYSNGKFRHFFLTDDGQVWYGVGTYKDQNENRILRFSDADTSYKFAFRIRYESNFLRTLKIQGKSFRSEDFYGTTGGNEVVFSERQVKSK